MTVSEEDQNLINASRILIYYIRMYFDSLDWLKENTQEKEGWDFFRNAILEGHLLYTRILIEFITKRPKYPSDRFAVSYFYDSVEPPFPIYSKKLVEYKNLLDKQLAHITSGSTRDFKIKSHQTYEVFSIANELLPHLQYFFELVPEDRIYTKIKLTPIQIFRHPLVLYSPLDISSST